MNLTKENIYQFCAILLLFSLGFSKAIPTIILVLLMPFALAKLYKNRFYIPAKRTYAIFSCLLLYTLSKSLLFNSINAEFQIYSRAFFVVAVPLVFLFLEKHKIALGFIAGVATAVLISSIKIIIYYSEYKTIPLSNGDAVYEVLTIHRPFFGFACLVSAILCLYISSCFPKYKKRLYLLAFVFVFFLFFIAARLSIITTILLALVYLCFYSKFTLRIKATVFVLASIIIIIGITRYSNLSNRFFVKEKLETIIDYEPRFVIWKCAASVVSSENFNVFFGSKTREWVQSELTNCYASSIESESKRQWYLKEKFHSHNQFIDFFLSGGIVALSLFVAFCGSLLYISKENIFMLFIAISLILFFVLDNILYTQFGGYITGIVLILMMKQEQQK